MPSAKPQLANFIDASRRYNIITYTHYVDSGRSITDTADILTGLGYDAWISPLHDKDMTEDGQPKKAHYHIVIDFGHPARFFEIANCIQFITNSDCWYTQDSQDAITANMYTQYYDACINDHAPDAWHMLYRSDWPQRVGNLRKMLQYLTHEDPASLAKHKHVYERDKVILVGYAHEVQYGSGDDDPDAMTDILWQIMDWIDTNNVVLYRDLLQHIRHDKLRDWQACLMRYGGRAEIQAYMRSQEYATRSQDM